MMLIYVKHCLLESVGGQSPEGKKYSMCSFQDSYSMILMNI